MSRKKKETKSIDPPRPPKVQKQHTPIKGDEYADVKKNIGVSHLKQLLEQITRAISVISTD